MVSLKLTPVPFFTRVLSLPHCHGVAIILSRKAQAAWEAAGSVVKPISDRIMCVRLKAHLSYVTCFAIYAPTNPTSSTVEASQPSEDFYSELHSALNAVPSTDMVVLLGDFNARVGTDTQTWHTVLGPHGAGEVNDNGQRLLDFCATNSLLITNSWFQHVPHHKFTWYRNGNRSNPGHVIDYVLVSSKFRSSVLDTRVYRGVHHESDHELVVSTFRFKIKVKRQLSRHFTPRQTECLQRDTVASFRSSLSDAYESHISGSTNTHTPPSSEDVWDSFKTAFQDTSSNLPLMPQRKEADWITDEVRNLSKRKKDVRLHLRAMTIVITLSWLSIVN